MQISKYKNLGQGWNGESQRHSNAKRFGIAGGLYKITKKDYENKDAILDDKDKFSDYAISKGFDEEDVEEFIVDYYENLKSFKENLSNLKKMVKDDEKGLYAQHYSIKGLLHNKKFAEINNSIINWFEKQPIYTVRGSLKYQRLEKNDEPDYRINKNNENEEVYIWNRSIPKGYVYGDDKGSFEIHYDSKKRKVIQIYLVA
jgi:hypothetical protein